MAQITNMRAILFLVFPALALGFCPLSKKSFATSSLGMAPRFDNKLNKWVAPSPEEGPEAGYDIWGSLVRQGPFPSINRVCLQGRGTRAGRLERNTAQAEMDAYLRNPNDWNCESMN